MKLKLLWTIQWTADPPHTWYSCVIKASWSALCTGLLCRILLWQQNIDEIPGLCYTNKYRVHFVCRPRISGNGGSLHIEILCTLKVCHFISQEATANLLAQCRHTSLLMLNCGEANAFSLNDIVNNKNSKWGQKIVLQFESNCK